jgi:hypothetical protein
MGPEPTTPNAWRAFRSDWRRQTTVAYVLWVLLAGVVWNVVFDRVLVLAGRRYVYAAFHAFERGGPPVLIEPWMRDARRQAVRWATLVAGPLAVAGVIAVRLASRRHAPRAGPAQPSPPQAPAAR